MTIKKIASEIVRKSLLENTDNQVLANFINELNIDLEKEYSAAIQYIQHAAMVKGAQYTDVIGELSKHADEEIAHAKVLSDRISYLGGVPSFGVDVIKTASDSATMLAQDKEGEEEAIERYKVRIKQAEELGDYGTKALLMDILKDEEEHKNDLMVALGE